MEEKKNICWENVFPEKLWCPVFGYLAISWYFFLTFTWLFELNDLEVSWEQQDWCSLVPNFLLSCIQRFPAYLHTQLQMLASNNSGDQKKLLPAATGKGRREKKRKKLVTVIGEKTVSELWLNVYLFSQDLFFFIFQKLEPECSSCLL